MDRWFSKALGDGVEAHAQSNEIKQAFLALAVANGGKTGGVAVFSRYDLQANMVTVYFTPKAEVLAKTYAATPCEKPSRGNSLGLLVGDVSAWDLLGD